MTVLAFTTASLAALDERSFGVQGTPYLIQRLPLGSPGFPAELFWGPWLGSGLLAPEDSAEVLFQRREELLVAQRPAGALMSTQKFHKWPRHPSRKFTIRV
jgi:hypothetical protein